MNPISARCTTPPSRMWPQYQLSWVLLAKINIKSAYRLILVHPGDHWLLGMKWEGNFYVDPMLPFRLRSSAKIFNTVADALEWRLKAVGAPYVHHYLDNFMVLGAPGSNEGPRALEMLLFTCLNLGGCP